MFEISDEYTPLFEELRRRNVDQTRYYEVKGDIMYPSVTSVISFISRKKFADWRARVGEEAANRKTKRATTRGTNLHSLFEVFLQNGDF